MGDMIGLPPKLKLNHHKKLAEKMPALCLVKNTRVFSWRCANDWSSGYLCKMLKLWNSSLVGSYQKVLGRIWLLWFEHCLASVIEKGLGCVFFLLRNAMRLKEKLKAWGKIKWTEQLSYYYWSVLQAPWTIRRLCEPVFLGMIRWSLPVSLFQLLHLWFIPLLGKT